MTEQESKLLKTAWAYLTMVDLNELVNRGVGLQRIAEALFFIAEEDAERAKVLIKECAAEEGIRTMEDE